MGRPLQGAQSGRFCFRAFGSGALQTVSNTSAEGRLKLNGLLKRNRFVAILVSRSPESLAKISGSKFRGRGLLLQTRPRAH